MDYNHSTEYRNNLNKFELLILFMCLNTAAALGFDRDHMNSFGTRDLMGNFRRIHPINCHNPEGIVFRDVNSASPESLSLQMSL